MGNLDTWEVLFTQKNGALCELDIFVKTLQLTNILNVVICLDQNKIIQKEQY